MLTKKGKLTFASLLLSSMLITTTYATEQNVSNVDKTDETILNINKTFPETLTVLMNAPGKKDEITIPMPTVYYGEKLEEVYNGKWSERKNKLKYILDNSSISEQGDITLLKLNTNIKESSFSVAETTGSFYYTYTVGNGYVLSTEISTYTDKYEDGEKERFDFLRNSFDKYLVAKGFKKEKSIYNYLNPVTDEMIYTLDNHIIIVTIHNDLIIKTFSVVMKNKIIEDDKESITKNLNEEAMKRDFKSLETILK